MTTDHPDSPVSTNVASTEAPPRGRTWVRRVLIALSVLALLAAGVVARRTYIERNDDETVTNPRVQRSGPGLVETFNRDDGALGAMDNGAVWEVTSGRWEIDGESARLVDADTDRPRNVTVADALAADLSIDLRLPEVAPGAGLVFRYKNPLNYWMVTAVPGVGTWNLHKVVDGEVELVGNVGQVSTGPGTLIGVRASGDTIAVLVGGEVRETWTDQGFAADATRVGLVSPSTGATGRFDDLVATVLGSGATTTTTAAGDSSGS